MKKTPKQSIKENLMAFITADFDLLPYYQDLSEGQNTLLQKKLHFRWGSDVNCTARSHECDLKTSRTSICNQFLYYKVSRN